jgi:outer membrane protein OmpA-like peptidoglycan-associated protein
MNDQGQEQTYLLGLLLLVFPNVTIEIHGHSDPSENETYSGPKPYLGYTLSKLRADCVYRRIIHQGVSADRMRIQGHAATRPITTGETNEGRQQNRRVEIVVKPRG